VVRIVPVARKRIAEGKIVCRESKNKFFSGIGTDEIFISRFKELAFFLQ
jgi:hypothetical protein